MRRFLCSAIIYASIVFTPLSSFAGWALYDNFNSGTINPNLWELTGSSADVSVVKGKVKFVHKLNKPAQSTWLRIKKNRVTVKGIKVSVFVNSSTGDLRARTGFYMGKIGADTYVWNQLVLRQMDLNIWGDVFLEKHFSNGTTQDIDSSYHCWFRNPMDSNLIGKWFTISVTFTPNSAVYTVNGMGKSTYVAPASLKATKPEDNYIAIGTRSSDGSGSGTVYFDNVYVLR